MLKFLISRSKLQTTPSGWREDHQKAIDAVSRKTMGNLIDDFLDSVYSEPDDSGTALESEDVSISFSFLVEADESHIEQRRAALARIVEERNFLIHEMLSELDQKSEQSCRDLSALLDEQHHRMVPEYDNLRALVLGLLEGRKRLKAALVESAGNTEDSADK